MRNFQNATEEVFSTMLGIPVIAQTARRQSSGPQPTSRVVALIGLSGDWVGRGRSPARLS